MVPLYVVRFPVGKGRGVDGYVVSPMGGGKNAKKRTIVATTGGSDGYC